MIVFPDTSSTEWTCNLYRQRRPTGVPMANQIFPGYEGISWHAEKENHSRVSAVWTEWDVSRSSKHCASLILRVLPWTQVSNQKRAWTTRDNQFIRFFRCLSHMCASFCLLQNTFRQSLFYLLSLRVIAVAVFLPWTLKSCHEHGHSDMQIISDSVFPFTIFSDLTKLVLFCMDM
jgi:hypothetical protein